MLARTVKLAAASLMFSTSLFAADSWFHIRVQETGGARVSINLPFTVLEKALPLAPIEDLRDGDFRCGRHDFDPASLRQVWMATSAAGEGKSVTIDVDGETVTAVRNGAELLMTTDEGTQVRLDAAVVEALVATGDQRFNVKGALEVIARRQSGGSLVMVTDDDATVRIWIDQDPASK